MTKQEILDALEGLKDFVNHVGKQSIDTIKASVLQDLNEQPKPSLKPEEAPIAEEDKKEEPKPEAFVSGGRFAEKKPVSHGTKKKK